MKFPTSTNLKYPLITTQSKPLIGWVKTAVLLAVIAGNVSVWIAHHAGLNHEDAVGFAILVNLLGWLAMLACNFGAFDNFACASNGARPATETLN